MYFLRKLFDRSNYLFNFRMFQHWPLSQNTNKTHGSCSCCFQTHQLHLKDNTIHSHGPRAARCPGSNKPALAPRLPGPVSSQWFDSQPLPSSSASSHFLHQTGGPVIGKLTSRASSNSPNSICHTSTSTNNSNTAKSHDSTTGSTTNSHTTLIIATAASQNNLTTSTTSSSNTTVSVSQLQSSSQLLLTSLSAHTNNNNQIANHPIIRGALIKHIPKSARPACCTALAQTLREITINSRNVASWDKLFNFAPNILLNPPKASSRSSLTEIIKSRITGSTVPSRQSSTLQKRGSFDLAKAVTSKVEDGNIKAALRLLCSDDRPADSSDAVLAAMQARHPPAPFDKVSAPDPRSFASLQLTETEVLKAIRSFPAGSSGGPDGLQPQHLLEMVACQANGANLLSAVTGFVNMVLDGGCPASVSPIFFGAKLVTLEKKSGGVRPIAIGYTLRRLVAKCANFYAQKKLADYFAPLQVGVGVSGGCEAAVHASRSACH